MGNVDLLKLYLLLNYCLFIFGRGVDYVTPNKPLADDPGRNKRVGKLEDYLQYLKKYGDDGFLSAASEDSGTIPKRRVRVSSESNAKYFTRLAGASYCSDSSLEAWSCKHCSTLSGVKLISVIAESKYDSKAIITLNTSRKEIVVSFRGSSNAKNWIENLKFDKTKFSGAGPGAEVHIGFKNIADALQPQYNAHIKSLLSQSAYSDYNIVVIGHSLGGAVALLAVTYIQQYNELPWARLQLFTYGKPRVGNPTFINWFNSLPLSVTRVVNENDVVPHAPPKVFNYLHEITEIYIKDGKSKFCSASIDEDHTCSNSRVPFLSINQHLNAWGIQFGAAGC